MRVNKANSGDAIIRCPMCSAPDSIIVAEITCDAIRGKDIVTIARGHRRACTRCPNVFSTGPEGAYQQHPGSHPWMPQREPEAVREKPADAGEEKPRERQMPPAFAERPFI